MAFKIGARYCFWDWFFCCSVLWCFCYDVGRLCFSHFYPGLLRYIWLLSRLFMYPFHGCLSIFYIVLASWFHCLWLLSLGAICDNQRISWPRQTSSTLHRAAWCLRGCFLRSHCRKSPAGTSEISQPRSGWSSANKNLRPEGTLGNLTTNIFHRILRCVFEEMSHIPLEMILFGGVRLGW